MFVYKQGNLIEKLLAQDCLYVDLTSDANKRWCVSNGDLRSTIFTYFKYTPEISVEEYRMHGSVFIEVKNEGKRERGSVFKADVSICAQEACTERTCGRYRQAKTMECLEDFFKGSLVVYEDCSFGKRNIDCQWHVINSLKGVFQKNLFDEKLWKNAGNVIRKFALERDLDSHGCEGESVMMCDLLRSRSRLFGLPVQPFQVKDCLVLRKKEVLKRHEPSRFSKYISNNLRERDYEDSLDIAIFVLGLWRGRTLLIVFISVETEFLVYLNICDVVRDRVVLALSVKEVEIARLRSIAKEFRMRMRIEDLKVPMKFRSFLVEFGFLRRIVTYLLRMFHTYWICRAYMQIHLHNLKKNFEAILNFGLKRV